MLSSIIVIRGFSRSVRTKLIEADKTVASLVIISSSSRINRNAILNSLVGIFDKEDLCPFLVRDMSDNGVYNQVLILRNEIIIEKKIIKLLIKKQAL